MPCLGPVLYGVVAYGAPGPRCGAVRFGLSRAGTPIPGAFSDPVALTPMTHDPPLDPFGPLGPLPPAFSGPSWAPGPLGSLRHRFCFLSSAPCPPVPFPTQWPRPDAKLRTRPSPRFFDRAHPALDEPVRNTEQDVVVHCGQAIRRPRTITAFSDKAPSTIIVPGQQTPAAHIRRAFHLGRPVHLRQD